jgi:hypothetical protein
MSSALGVALGGTKFQRERGAFGRRRTGANDSSAKRRGVEMGTILRFSSTRSKYGMDFLFHEWVRAAPVEVGNLRTMPYFEIQDLFSSKSDRSRILMKCKCDRTNDGGNGVMQENSGRLTSCRGTIQKITSSRQGRTHNLLSQLQRVP